MNILYFLAHPYDIGGASKQLIAHARIAKAAGHNIKMVIQEDVSGNHGKEYDLLLDELEISSDKAVYPVAVCIEEIDILAAEGAIEGIRGLVEQFSPELIHSVQINIAVEIVARLLNIPHIMSIYQVLDDMFTINWEKIFARHICVDSEYYCAKWREGLKAEARCIRVLYDKNTTINRNVDKITDEQAIRIVSIGGFEPRKRQLEILKFARKCKDDNIKIHLIFLGDDAGGYGDCCKLFIKENDLDDEVEIPGRVLHIEQYLCSSDLMIHASVSESYPGVIVEAMANGIPLICTPVAGVPEIVKDGYNGILTAGYGYNDIYDSFVRYREYLKKGIISQMIRNELQTYHVHHTDETAGKELLQYYDYVVNKNDSREETGIQVFRKIDHFYEDLKSDIQNDYTREHMWFLYHLNEMSPPKKVMIWGAGRYGEIAVEWCKLLKWEIDRFVDSTKEGMYLGMQVSPPSDELLLRSDMIIVAIWDQSATESIMKRLKGIGKERNRDYILMVNSPCLSDLE